MVRRWLSIALIGVVLAGCGPVPGTAKLPTGGVQSLTLFQVPQNDAGLLVDGGEIFPAAYQMLNAAQRSIQIDLFLLGDGIGKQVANILAAKRAAGVDVQVVVDPHDGVLPKERKLIRPILDSMIARGIPVRTYPTNRLPGGNHWLVGLQSINHAKILVADGEKAMVGGMNFLDGEAINHDYMVQVTGQRAQDLGQLVDYDFRLAGGETPAPPTVGPWIGEHGIGKNTLRSLWLDALNKATRTIDLQMMLVDQPEGLAALKAAKDRGVTVRVMLDRTNLGKHGASWMEKLPLQGAPNWAGIKYLREAGIDVSWYVPRQHLEFLHTKMAVIDGTTAVIGTANFTQKAWTQNRELSVRLDDPAVVGRLARTFADDWRNHADPIDQLTRWQRFVAGIFERVSRKQVSPQDAERAIEAVPAD